MKIGLFVVLFLLSSSSAAQSAVYRITFIGTWTSSDSSSYPFSAHFTELIGAAHVPGEGVWQRGGLASRGVEDVAELGLNSNIVAELQQDVAEGIAGPSLELDSLFNLPNSTSIEVEIFESRPNITLISMLAPSSDWFVGVSELPLRNSGGWIDFLEVDLHPYDAGTEEGATFSLDNDSTNPQAPIALIGESPFFEASPVVGMLRLERIVTEDPEPPVPPRPAPPPPANPEAASYLLPSVNLILED